MIKLIVKNFLVFLLRHLPPYVSEWLGQFSSNPKALHLAREGLKNRAKDVTIRNGVATGLKFNSKYYNIKTSLGTYELPVQQALTNYLKPGDIFYDIGANVGFFSIIAAKLVGSRGRVYAFEPSPQNAADLRHNIKINGFSNIDVIEKAVSSNSGKGKLLLADYCGAYSLSRTNFSTTVARDEITVELISIDDAFTSQKLLPPDVVKIDVEGAEEEVLRGMVQTIKQFQPIVIYEIDDKVREIFERKQQQINSILHALKYKIIFLEDSYSEIAWHVGHSVAIPEKKRSPKFGTKINYSDRCNVS